MPKRKSETLPEVIDGQKEPGPRNRAAIDRAVASNKERPIRVNVGIIREADNTMSISPTHSDTEGFGLSITRGAVSGKNHVASAPGQPPNADSGVLDKGIGVYPVPRNTADGIEVTIVSTARYSEALEFGTSKMSARPFFRPARDKKRKAAKRLFDNAVKKILNGAAE